MTGDAFQRWQQVVTSADPNAEPPVDWAAFESSIGMRLPADYKAHIDLYGVGCINGLFWVRHPTSKYVPNLLQAPDDWRSAQDGERYLAALFTNRLPQLGFTEAGYVRDQILIQRHPHSAAARARWNTTRAPDGPPPVDNIPG
jgi:hypothetical protein